MPFLQWLGIAGVFASILGAWLAWATRYNGRETRAFIKETQKMISEGNERTQKMIDEGNERTQKMIDEGNKHLEQILLKIDERHTKLFGEILGKTH